MENHLIFDLYYDSFLVINSELKVVYANEAAALLFGTSIRRLTNGKKTLLEIVEFTPKFDPFEDIENIVDPTPVREVDFVATSGKTGKGQITVQADPSNPGNWIMYIRDVTLEETLQKKYRAELDQKEEVIEDLKKAQSELENYSRNLEKMVEERTAEVQKLHRLQTAMLDSLGQGFLVFDKQGQCYPTYSKACEEILETVPTEKPIWDVLKLPETKVEGFQKWTQAVFDEMLPFPDLAPLGPESYDHSTGKHVRLEYHPMRVEEKIDGLVMVASDITKLVEAEKEAAREKAHADMITSVIRNRRQLASFVRDTREFLKELDFELAKPQPDIEALFRIVHTLKGGAASFSILEMVELTHAYESQLAEGQGFEDNQDLIDKLRKDKHLIVESFESFLSQNQELVGPSLLDGQRYVEKPLSELEAFANQLTGSLEKNFRKSFIEEPIVDHFKHFAEIAESVAEQLGKSIAPIEFKNGDISITPEHYSEVFSTFVHAFRNAVDHGIETPASRVESGKPESGNIEVEFLSQNEGFKILIRDDGGGIDPERIRAKLSENGYNVDQETDQQVIQHVFDSRLSTKAEASDISGRGVGMDAIKAAAEKMGGSVSVDSVLGKGTTLEVFLPWVGRAPSAKPAA